MRWVLQLLLLVLVTAGCAKKEVRVSFELSDDINMPVRVLYYEEGEGAVGRFREMVADIRSGKGKFKIPTTAPIVFYLYAPSGKMPSGIVYAVPGDEIKISGSGQDISHWKIEGNDVTAQLSEWHSGNVPLLAEGDRVKINEKVSEFVKKNPSSVASVILLYLYYDRRESEADFATLQDLLSKDVLADRALMRSLSVADVFTAIDEYAEVPLEIVRMGDSGYADTLKFSDEKATLMVFRGGGSGSGVLPADSLRKLTARVAGGTVAEFYVDSDSVSWRGALRRDTIEGLRRFWLPLSMADSVSMALGVKRLPYYIVVDSLRNVKYRGSDWEEAVKSFEN